MKAEQHRPSRVGEDRNKEVPITIAGHVSQHRPSRVGEDRNDVATTTGVHLVIAAPALQGR